MKSGSVLCCILFLHYINDLGDHVGKVAFTLNDNDTIALILAKLDVAKSNEVLQNMNFRLYNKDLHLHPYLKDTQINRIEIFCVKLLGLEFESELGPQTTIKIYS